MDSIRVTETCVDCNKVFLVWDFRFDSMLPLGEDISEEDNRVVFQSDPFSSEIHDDHTEMWLCVRCAYESSMDI